MCVTTSSCCAHLICKETLKRCYQTYIQMYSYRCTDQTGFERKMECCTWKKNRLRICQSLAIASPVTNFFFSSFDICNHNHLSQFIDNSDNELVSVSLFCCITNAQSNVALQEKKNGIRIKCLGLASYIAEQLVEQFDQISVDQVIGKQNGRVLKSNSCSRYITHRTLGCHSQTCILIPIFFQPPISSNIQERITQACHDGFDGFCTIFLSDIPTSICRLFGVTDKWL
jgi:hypothetical protein